MFLGVLIAVTCRGLRGLPLFIVVFHIDFYQVRVTSP
jgi:hypothetical protein